MMFITTSSSSRVYSTKTRIKTDFAKFCGQLSVLREYIPLKQGLRLIKNHPSLFYCRLREYIPLKQGLRHFDKWWDKDKFNWSSRVYSTKTRIKTLKNSL